MEKKEFNFEDAMNRLDEIVRELESGKVSLDKSIALFEEGIKLSKQCEVQLKSVEEKAVKILQNNELNDFSVEE